MQVVRARNLNLAKLTPCLHVACGGLTIKADDFEPSQSEWSLEFFFEITNDKAVVDIQVFGVRGGFLKKQTLVGDARWDGGVALALA